MLEQNLKKFDVLIDNYTNMWNKIFQLGLADIDIKKPLTTKILSDSENKFVKTLIFVYSMESFIYKEINKASRSKDSSKLMYYGAYASALGFVIHFGNQGKLAKKK